jgi:hypothetical protein
MWAHIASAFHETSISENYRPAEKLLIDGKAILLFVKQEVSSSTFVLLVTHQ